MGNLKLLSSILARRPPSSAMLALLYGTVSFQAGSPSANMRRSAVAMSSPAKPSDFPVKNVWTTVCSAKDLKPNSLTAGFGAGQDILIGTNGAGKVFAAANVCPHIGTP